MRVEFHPEAEVDLSVTILDDDTQAPGSGQVGTGVEWPNHD